MRSRWIKRQSESNAAFFAQQKRTVKGSTPKAILLPPFFCFFRLIVRKGVDKVKKGATVEYEVTAAQDLTTDNIKFKEK